MDATSMFAPDSFHPDQMDLKYDFSGRARSRSRTERPPKYYFIDFGLSILFKPNELPATVLAFEGGDKSVPEFLADNPDQAKRMPKHDPFAVDIYYLGNAFRPFLLRVSHPFDSTSTRLTSSRESGQIINSARKRSVG